LTGRQAAGSKRGEMLLTDMESLQGSVDEPTPGN